MDARIKSGHDKVSLLRLGVLGGLALRKSFNAENAEVSRRNAEVISACRIEEFFLAPFSPAFDHGFGVSGGEHFRRHIITGGKAGMGDDAISIFVGFNFCEKYKAIA